MDIIIRWLDNIKNSKWNIYNDKVVKEFDSKTLPKIWFCGQDSLLFTEITKNAYILFYKKRVC